MRGWIVQFQHAIAGTRDNVAATHNRAADWHLAAQPCGAGVLEGELHERG